MNLKAMEWTFSVGMGMQEEGVRATWEHRGFSKCPYRLPVIELFVSHDAELSKLW
jgi:hypothetical protein